MDAETSTWNSLPVKILRYVAYIPISVFLLFILEVLFISFAMWLYRGSLREFIILSLLFGLPMLAFLSFLYGSAYKGLMYLCPTPKVGSIIFSVIYILFSVLCISGAWVNLSGSKFILYIIFKTAFMIAGIIVTVMLYEEQSRRIQS